MSKFTIFTHFIHHFTDEYYFLLHFILTLIQSDLSIDILYYLTYLINMTNSIIGSGQNYTAFFAKKY